MELEKLHRELLNLLSITNVWLQQGSPANLEIDLVKAKLHKVYDMLRELEQQNIRLEAKRRANETSLKVNESQEPQHTDSDVVEQSDSCQAPSNNNSDQESSDSDQESIDGCQASSDSSREQVQTTVQDEVELDGSNDTQPSQLHDIQLDTKSVETESMSADMVREQRYINELFDSNSEAYRSERAKMESMEQFDQVLIYISENYNWHSNSSVAEEFVSELAQRY